MGSVAGPRQFGHQGREALQSKRLDYDPVSLSALDEFHTLVQDLVALGNGRETIPLVPESSARALMGASFEEAVGPVVQQPSEYR
jgi:hypothetical protein